MTSVANAQEKQHKVGVKIGYGFWSLAELGSNLFSAGSDFNYEKEKVIGPLSLGLSYDLSEKVEVGVSGSYNRMREEGRYKPGSAPGSAPQDENRVVRIVDSRYYSVMVFVNVTWQQRGKLKYYSGGATGMGFVKRDEWFHNDKLWNEPYDAPAFHLTAVGAAYGQRIVAFAELGFGMHGLINAGLSFNL